MSGVPWLVRPWLPDVLRTPRAWDLLPFWGTPSTSATQVSMMRFDNGGWSCHAGIVAETGAGSDLPPLADPLPGKPPALVLPHLRLLLLEGRTIAEMARILDLPERTVQIMAESPLTAALTRLARDPS